MEGYRHIVGYHYSWILKCLTVRKRFDETRINVFIRLQDIAQGKRVTNDYIKTAMDQTLYL